MLLRKKILIGVAILGAIIIGTVAEMHGRAQAERIRNLPPVMFHGIPEGSTIAGRYMALILYVTPEGDRGYINLDAVGVAE